MDIPSFALQKVLVNEIWGHFRQSWCSQGLLKYAYCCYKWILLKWDAISDSVVIVSFVSSFLLSTFKTFENTVKFEWSGAVEQFCVSEISSN